MTIVQLQSGCDMFILSVVIPCFVSRAYGGLFCEKGMGRKKGLLAERFQGFDSGVGVCPFCP